MKKIFITILVLISVQSFGQVKTYFRRLLSNGIIDSGYTKPPKLDSVFAFNDNSFISFTVEYFNDQFQPVLPNQFANFKKGADGVYTNYTQRIEWDGVTGKPLTFPATASTVGGNLLNLSTPASVSIPRINSDGTTGTRTLPQVITDLGIDTKASLSGSEAITNKTMGAFNAALDAGANDSYVITLSPAPAAYTTGMIVIFRANTQNTTGCSINVNGLGVRTIVKRVNTTPATGDILAQMWCMLVYDGTNFILLNPVVN